MRYVFALGTGRCGSTLAHEILARHPQTSWLSNLEDRLGGRLGGRVDGAAATAYRLLPAAVTRKGRFRLAPSEGYRALETRVSPMLVAPVRDLTAADASPWLAGRTRAFFAGHHRAGRPVFLHKFTGWPRAGFLQAVWPEARFIHIVRDGRAVANSLLQMPWWQGWAGPDGWTLGPLPEPMAAEWERSGRSFTLLAGLQWKLLIDAYEQAQAKLSPESWLELRYEDLVARPREQVERLLGFCGLDWTPEFQRGFDRFSFSDGRTEAYRRDLAPGDVELLTSSLRGHLERFGYPVS